MEIIIDTHGVKLSKKQNKLHIQSKSQKRSVSFYQLTAITVSKSCTLSSDVIQAAAQHNIAISFLDATGKVRSKLWSPNFGSIATLRRKQIRFAENRAFIQYTIQQLIQKTKQQKKVLASYAKSKLTDFDAKTDKLWLQLLQKAQAEPIEPLLNQIRGTEGVIGSWYWAHLRQAAKSQFKIGLRRQRPATDAFNALLNYYYGMLYNRVETAIISMGLDPYLAFLHNDQYQQPTLAFDLIEQFRPWADALVLQLFYKKKVHLKDFDILNKKYYYLNSTGKKHLIDRFNQHLKQKEKTGKQNMMRKNYIRHQIEQLKQLINQTIP